MSRPTVTPTRLLAIAAVGVATLLSIVGIPVTSAQGTAVFAVRADGALPVDAPFDAAWDAARSTEVVMTGQAVVPPRLMVPSFPSVRVRSLVNDDRIAILLEWDDATRDESVLAVESFSDAAAIQFALGSGTSVCMGQQAGGLNIWHWKADWAADMPDRQDVEDVHPGMPDEARFPVDMGAEGPGTDGFLTGQMAGNPRSAATRPSSVEDLNAVGFGTLTTQEPEGQNVHGSSEYRDGVWRVVMSRPLSNGDPNDTVLQPGSAATVIAVAAWDGSRGDRNGLKSVSTWLSLVLPQKPMGPLDMWPFLFLLTLALVLSGLVMLYGSRQPAVGLGWPPGGPDRGGGE
ncbi:MAG: hypothetical protein A2Z32_03035 [Chloroflexi bacterium RBG_16_69_14]|nr:MAG: hypothetical protein A2Z32_03035 [Chloroflexi bacterium RBG_16_69_14]